MKIFFLSAKRYFRVLKILDDVKELNIKKKLVLPLLENLASLARKLQ